jgi:hypothetical protein
MTTESSVTFRRDQLQRLFGDDFEGLRQFELLMESVDEFLNVGFPASNVNLDTSGFNGLLSSADATVQLALDTLDNAVGGSDTQLQFNDNGVFGGAPLVYSGSKFTFQKAVKDYATEENIFVHNITEVVSVADYTEIQIKNQGQTLTLSNAVDGSRIQIKNRSAGDAILNFDIELQTVVYSAPVTMPKGDSYEMTYDSSEGRWVM